MDVLGLSCFAVGQGPAALPVEPAADARFATAAVVAAAAPASAVAPGSAAASLVVAVEMVEIAVAAARASAAVAERPAPGEAAHDAPAAPLVAVPNNADDRAAAPAPVVDVERDEERPAVIVLPAARLLSESSSTRVLRDWCAAVRGETAAAFLVGSCPAAFARYSCVRHSPRQSVHAACRRAAPDAAV